MSKPGMSICSTDDVTFAGMPKRGSRYAGVMESMSKLRVGQTLKLPVAEGTTIQVAMNRLNSALRRDAPDPPRGCVWEKNALEGKVIGISAVRKSQSRVVLRKKAAARKKAAKKKPRAKAKKRKR